MLRRPILAVEMAAAWRIVRVSYLRRGRMAATRVAADFNVNARRHQSAINHAAEGERQRLTLVLRLLRRPRGGGIRPLQRNFGKAGAESRLVGVASAAAAPGGPQRQSSAS